MLHLRTVLALGFFLSLAAAADPPGKDEWKYDEIQRKTGVPLRGLIIDQGDRSVKIYDICRRPGRPTLVFTEIVPREDIHRIVLLETPDRETLQKRIAALKQERVLLRDSLRAVDASVSTGARPADTLDFRATAWPGDDKRKALEYRSTYFRLVANTRPELAHLVAIHLEQVYAAYSRFLPPRATSEPTTILLTRSLADYQVLVKSHGMKLFNPAFYDPKKNQVVCGSDLERMCDELEMVRKHHGDLRAKMKERRAELVRVYRGRIPAEVLAPMADAEKRIVTTERRNERQFAQVRQKLFQRLYHEAFHAYLGTFVYPTKDGPLPTWFNEGLAQIFEMAIVEVGELRVRPADPDRLSAVRTALGKGGDHPALADLLLSQRRQFQVAHARDEQVSDRCYRAAWALTVYLTFEKHLLGTKALDDYVAALNRGTDPLVAFRDLVGKPLPTFEKDLHDYLRRLRPDGSLGN